MEPLLVPAVLVLFVAIRIIIPATVIFSLAKLVDHIVSAN